MNTDFADFRTRISHKKAQKTQGEISRELIRIYLTAENAESFLDRMTGLTQIPAHSALLRTGSARAQGPLIVRRNIVRRCTNLLCFLLDFQSAEYKIVSALAGLPGARK